MAKYQVAVLGCGAIFNRHLAALKANPEYYDFIGYYEPDAKVREKWHSELHEQKEYASEAEVFADDGVNFVAILSPSHLHFAQAKAAILNGKNVLLEKPASFRPEQVNDLIELAAAHNVEVFCVLQVRLNQSITIVQRMLQQQLLGDIRGAALVQRWQRPANYFNGWRETYSGCGGILNEFGIHYLDIMQFLLGTPVPLSAKFYKAKFKEAEVADSAYALLDYGNYGATMEISLAAEPRNIDLSLTIMGSQGFVKLGAKSLDQITEVGFLQEETNQRYQQICQDVLGYNISNQATIGACPHHPELYKQLIENPTRFRLKQTYDVIKLIQQINKLDVK
jgi:predicted dehydrogenase